MYVYGLISTKTDDVSTNLGVIFFDYDGGDFEVKIKETALALLESANHRIKEELAQLKECLTELWNSIKDCDKFRDSLCAYIEDKNSTIGKYVTLRSFPYFDKSNNSQDYSGVTIRGKNYFEQYLKSLDYRAALFFCETHEGDEAIQSRNITIYPIYSVIDKGWESGQKVLNAFVILEDDKFRTIKPTSYRWLQSLGCDLEEGAYIKIECFIKCVAVVCGRAIKETISRLRNNRAINRNKLMTLNISEFRNMECLYQGKEFVDLYIGEAVDMVECVKDSLDSYNGFAQVIDHRIQTSFWLSNKLMNKTLVTH